MSGKKSFTRESQVAGRVSGTTATFAAYALPKRLVSASSSCFFSASVPTVASIDGMPALLTLNSNRASAHEAGAAAGTASVADATCGVAAATSDAATPDAAGDGVSAACAP